LQLVNPLLHDGTHAPEAQTTVPLAGAVHARPQAPQFVVVLTSVQTVPHIICPVGQGEPQVPAEHT
jgi:hypothetical protein